jgi:DNA-binding CsgD family transcriptional regulator
VELVRDYASEQLVEEGEQAQVEEAHTRAVIAFALARSEAVEAADDEVAQAEMARSEADLRSALRRLVGRADVEDGLLLATALAPFVLRRGYDGFVGQALTSLLRRARQVETGDARLARATMWKAWLTAQFAQPDTAGEVRADLADALRLARRSGAEETLLQALSLVMQTLQVTGDVAAASAAVAEGLPLVEATGDRRRTARFCAWAGIVATQTGRVEDALALARRGLDNAARDDVRTQILLMLELSAQPRDRAAGLMLRLPPVGELIHEARRLDDPRYVLLLLRGAAWLSLGEGDLRTAAARCADSLRLSYRRAAWRDLPFAILPLAVVAARRRDHVDAARLHGMVRSRVDLIRGVVPPARFEEYLAAVEVSRRALGESVFEAMADRGEAEMRIDALTGPLRYADSVVVGDTGRPHVPPQSRRPEPEQLTPREEEVLRELVTGATNKEISHRLGMAPKTVMHHSVAIYRKLGVRGRAEATAWAFRHGLVE